MPNKFFTDSRPNLEFLSIDLDIFCIFSPDYIGEIDIFVNIEHIEIPEDNDYVKHNYLEGQAFQIVQEIHDLDQIWERLRSSFGNVSILLTSKFSDIDKGVPLFKIRNNDEKLVQSMTKIKNSMKELSQLAKKHDIEGTLYHPSNLSKFFYAIGENRQFDIKKKCF